jgi:predicted RNA binding protein YcfA (HicA-like mRNA interferase family)
MSRCRTLKVRDLRARLREFGATHSHQTGSHEMWRLPSGALIPFPGHHQNAEISRNVMGTLRKMLREHGLTL